MGVKIRVTDVTASLPQVNILFISLRTGSPYKQLQCQLQMQDQNHFLVQEQNQAWKFGELRYL